MPDIHQYLLLGAGGHAKVLLECLRLNGIRVEGVLDPALVQQQISHWQSLPVLGDDSRLADFDPQHTLLINGLGSLPGRPLHQQLYQLGKSRGFSFASVIHPSAWIAEGCTLGEGAQVMAGAIIQPGCVLGANVIVNTRASIDHDCTLADHVHMAPGSLLCGSVMVGEAAHIGTGAVITQAVKIGHAATIGAGASVTRNIQAQSRVLPAALRITQGDA